VIDQRDYWNEAEDTATPPPEDWGPIAAHEHVEKDPPAPSKG
jgi:hypothetical protein